jgi:drug/metabolite transporter (DMT)-like permease
VNRLQANICLLCVTLCWSSEVILFACIPAGVPAFATTCVTSIAGAALLAVPFRRRVAAALRGGGWRLVFAGILLAALSTMYNTLYLVGVKSFDVASGAFTFSMTVVVLPVVLLTMRRRVERATWVAVVLVTAGIVLALGPTLRTEHAPGLAVVGLGCLLRAVHIVILADFVKKHDPLAVAVLLQAFAGAMALAGWAFEDPRLFAGLPLTRPLVATWALYSYFVVAFAQTLNVTAMRRVTAANATVIYSVEIIFSLAWGVLLPEGIVERIAITPHIAIGALLVVAGSLAEILDLGGKRKEALP